MLNNKNIISYLAAIGLSKEEAALYVELLKQPRSHLELSRATGINRSKVYRLADQLEKRSLITSRTDDSGTLLVAADPKTLEVEIVTREEELKNKRAAFALVMPELEALQTQANGPAKFSVQTYDGEDGFKQMLWHELKCQGEILIFGFGALEDLVSSKRWAETHRQKSVEAGYTVREIINPKGKDDHFTKNQEFYGIFQKRLIPYKTLPLNHQLCIYNDTVAVYAWQNDQKVGYEVTNESYATMQRAIFEHYWTLAGK